MLHRETKAPALSHTWRSDIVSDLLREAVARAAKGLRAEADLLLRAVRVFDADRAGGSAIVEQLAVAQTEGAAPQESPRDASRLRTTLFRRAVQAHQARDFDRAERLYRASLVLAPSNAMVWSNLAAILLQKGDPEEAISASRKALDLSPTHLNALINLAAALQKNGALDKSVETYRLALTHHPNRLDLYRSLGSALESDDRLEEARAVYEAWTEVAPDNPDVYMTKATVLEKLECIDEAIGAYANVAALDPDNAAAYSAMGVLMARYNPGSQLDEAASLCLRAAALKSDSPPILYNLAIVLQIRGDIENALLILEGLARLHPTFAAAHWRMASILSARGRHEEAEIVCDRARALDRTSEAA